MELCSKKPSSHNWKATGCAFCYLGWYVNSEEVIFENRFWLDFFCSLAKGHNLYAEKNEYENVLLWGQ